MSSGRIPSSFAGVSVSRDGRALSARPARSWLWAIVTLANAVNLVLLTRDLSTPPRLAVWVLAIVLLICGGLLWLRPARVDTEGIRSSPLGRTRPWRQVDAVLAPGRWDATVRVVADGHARPTPFPAEAAAQIAELGGVPLSAPPDGPGTSVGDDGAAPPDPCSGGPA